MLSRRARRTIAAASAALGLMLLLGLPLAAPAGAGSSPLTIYDSVGVARPVHFQMTVRPSILDPLVEAGAGYAEASMSSQGGGASYALAAPLYPGKLGVGAIGCGGLKGWVIAKYPAAGGCGNHSHDSFLHDPAQPSDNPNPKGDFTTTGLVNMQAKAVLDASRAVASGALFELRGGDKNAPPVIEVAALRTESAARWTPARVTQTATAVAERITIRAGDAILRIDGVRSDASTASDGLTGVAEGAFTIGEASVEIGGVEHRAAIDAEGVHVVHPSVSREVLAPIQRSLDLAFDEAGIKVTVGAPTEIVDGASGEVSVGGLIVRMIGTVPPLQYPAEARPVIATIVNNFPTTCLSDFKDFVAGTPLEPAAATLCFGYGAVPGPGTKVDATLTIAAASARTAAAEGFVFDGGGGGNGGGFIPPPPPPDGGFDPGPSFDPPPPQPDPGPVTSPPQMRRPVLYGLVANMPSGALAGAGAGLLVLAVGLIAVPSLRP